MAGTHDSEVFEVEVRDRENPLPLTQGHGEGELWGLCVNDGTIATCGDDCSVRFYIYCFVCLKKGFTIIVDISSFYYCNDFISIAYFIVSNFNFFLKNSKTSSQKQTRIN